MDKVTILEFMKEDPAFGIPFSDNIALVMYRARFIKDHAMTNTTANRQLVDQCAREVFGVEE